MRDKRGRVGSGTVALSAAYSTLLCLDDLINGRRPLLARAVFLVISHMLAQYTENEPGKRDVMIRHNNG